VDLVDPRQIVKRNGGTRHEWVETRCRNEMMQYLVLLYNFKAHLLNLNKENSLFSIYNNKITPAASREEESRPFVITLDGTEEPLQQHHYTILHVVVIYMLYVFMCTYII
jgi:hypothetical protein